MGNACAAGLHRLSGHIATLIWPYHFSASASFRRSALICASAYILFRRWFSSCNYLSWDIIDTSIPPNLLRHL